MAKIFSPEEVKSKKVPSSENFLYAAEWLLDRFSRQTPPSEGVLIFGSTTNGTANRRSDLDILVSFKPDNRRHSEAVRSYNDLFSKAESKFNVPVEPIIFSAEQLISGRHTIDPLFLRHLASVDSKKWVAESNPVQSIKESNDIDWLEIFIQYSIHKEKKFKKAIINNLADIDYKVLQRAYELPSALGRKCLGLLVETGKIEDEQYHTAPKKNIIQKISNIAVPTVVGPLTHLIDSNNIYSEVLESALHDDTSIHEYEEWLKNSYSTTIDAALDFTVELTDFTVSKL